MDLIKGNLKKIYFEFLAASFGSTLISMIYGIVDMAMVGKFEGPDASAALACFSPVWNIIFAIGLLTGIGGGVLYSNEMGRGERDRANGFFTLALLLTALFILPVHLALIFFDGQILTLFGADKELLPYAQKYLFPLKFCLPVFTFNNFLSCFIRNDKRPHLSTTSVLAGGVFNVFGDQFFVFTLRLGAMGAGIATGIGAFITLFVLLSHFFSKKNTLRLKRNFSFGKDTLRVLSTGFASFFVDVTMGIFTIFSNNQIMRYLTKADLSVYAVIIQLFTFAQCCAYSVGQAAQPIMAENFGAGEGKRVKTCLIYGTISAFVFGAFWMTASMIFPNAFVRVFMDPTEEILKRAPFAIRIYATSFILLSLNVASTYYFQSVLKRTDSIVISFLRGIFLNGILIYLLPALFQSGNAIWFVMPITEALTFVYVALRIFFTARSLKKPNLSSCA